jgi:hypothetical protein
MTQDEIIQMAFDAGFDWSGEELTWEGVICTEELMAFAKLVAQTEREACANLCWKNEDDNAFVNQGGKRLDLLCAELIRARGET